MHYFVKTMVVCHTAWYCVLNAKPKGIIAVLTANTAKHSFGRHLSQCSLPSSHCLLHLLACFFLSSVQLPGISTGVGDTETCSLRSMVASSFLNVSSFPFHLRWPQYKKTLDLAGALHPFRQKDITRTNRTSTSTVLSAAFVAQAKLSIS